MSNNPAALKNLLVKVDRAYKHLIDLQYEDWRFRSRPYPYEVFSEDNAETSERTYYIRMRREIPPEFSALVGDIAQNLRSALDHLAWHLVKSSSVVPKTKDTNIYFPIFETAREYRAGKMRKIQGMTDAAIHAIDAVEPYYRPDITPGIGNGAALFALHAINLQDKHRLLIPVWFASTGHTITKSRRSEVANVLRAAFGTENADVMIPLELPNGSLEDGGKLCTLPIAEVDDNMKFRFRIAFGEPKWVCGKEIVSTLKNMHRMVKKTIVDFDSQGLL
jgi:hypothetical protein